MLFGRRFVGSCSANPQQHVAGQKQHQLDRRRLVMQCRLHHNSALPTNYKANLQVPSQSGLDRISLVPLVGYLNAVWPDLRGATTRRGLIIDLQG